MQYIGLDLHAKTFSLAVLDEQGRLVWENTSPTSGHNLVRLMTTLAGAKTVALEESTLADWAFRLLSPHGKLVVADPRQNRWIAGDEKMDDRTAARKLAELLYAGMLHPVHHSPSAQRQEFKELVQAHHDTSKQLTRFKNKLKAKFRRVGVPCGGRSVYSQRDRDDWLAKLPSAGARTQVSLLWETIDHLGGQQRCLRRELSRLGRHFPQVERFRQVPGVGLIRAATIFALWDTPDRFPTKGKLMAYCGLGLARASSGETQGPQHLTYFGNRVLKDALKGAALSAITQGDNPFAEKYQRLVNEGGPPALAQLSVARSIATTLWAMWRRDEDYQPQRPSQWESHGHGAQERERQLKGHGSRSAQDRPRRAGRAH